jgi:hypothetical protein
MPAPALDFNAGKTARTANSAEMGVQKVLSKKDEAILEKFRNAKKWIGERKPLVNRFFTDNMVRFKNGMDKAFQDIMTKIKEFKDKVDRKNYTLMEKQRTPSLYLEEYS